MGVFFNTGMKRKGGIKKKISTQWAQKKQSYTEQKGVKIKNT
jgi:hypothetical protein